MTENSFSICPGLSVTDSQSLQASLLWASWSSASLSLGWPSSLIFTLPFYIPSLSCRSSWELEFHSPCVFWLDTVNKSIWVSFGRWVRNKNHCSLVGVSASSDQQLFWATEDSQVAEIMDSSLLYHLWDLLKIKKCWSWKQLDSFIGSDLYTVTPRFPECGLRTIYLLLLPYSPFIHCLRL